MFRGLHGEVVAQTVLRTVTKQILDPPDQLQFALAIVRRPPSNGFAKQPEVA
jgi:hypothetical protein